MCQNGLNIDNKTDFTYRTYIKRNVFFIRKTYFYGGLNRYDLKKFLLILIVLLFLTAAADAQKSLNSKVGFEYQGRPLTEFLNKAEAETGLRFFYKDNWVNSITIQTATSEKAYKWVIDNAISAYGLTYIVFQERNIIFIPQGFTVDNDKLTEINMKPRKCVNN